MSLPMLWYGGLCGCLLIFVLISECLVCKSVSSSLATSLPQSLSFTHLPFTLWHPLLKGGMGEVGLWQDRAAFARDDSFCDRRCKGGAPAGDHLQRDISAAASVAAVSRQCLRFYGTFITICHSFNGMACVSCRLPPATAIAPRHMHTHTR